MLLASLADRGGSELVRTDIEASPESQDITGSCGDGFASGDAHDSPGVVPIGRSRDASGFLPSRAWGGALRGVASLALVRGTAAGRGANTPLPALLRAG